ncbi:uncharacterized protein ATNIH1004_008452 [Aspergillus tanneri]|uniref:Uncharacterized protein n=1 Tax=Aspergillus tanneri TaxID=1220188 RepID=A0A5M9MGY8_9EURO|nr:uncharacterized protein ATNIH1004_008452 [Aspergillus tanneri]KAA8644253.1 hypothetical protein ATNIH1004_008452 [Aspergillus tanneri]
MGRQTARRRELIATLHLILHKVKQSSICNRPCRLVSAVVSRYFPTNRTMAMVRRLASSYLCGVTAMGNDLVLPGNFQGYRARQSTGPASVVDAIVLLRARNRLGVAFDTRGQLEATLSHRCRDPPIFPSSSSSLSVSCTSSWWCYHSTLSATASFLGMSTCYNLQPRSGRHRKRDTAPTDISGTALAQREANLLRTMIHRCENIIALQKRLLNTKTEELRTVRHQMEDGRALVKQPSARPILTEKTQLCESVVIIQLRIELPKKDTQFSVARGQLRRLEDNVTATQWSFGEESPSGKTAGQREGTGGGQFLELGMPSSSPSRTAWPLARPKSCSLAAGTSRSTSSASSSLTIITSSMPRPLENESLQASLDQLSQQLEGPVVTIQLEGNAALGQVFFLQKELATAQSSVENTAREAQEALAHTSGT